MREDINRLHGDMIDEIIISFVSISPDIFANSPIAAAAVCSFKATLEVRRERREEERGGGKRCRSISLILLTAQLVHLEHRGRHLDHEAPRTYEQVSLRRWSCQTDESCSSDTQQGKKARGGKEKSFFVWSDKKHRRTNVLAHL